jgi:hypothetical protein
MWQASMPARDIGIADDARSIICACVCVLVCRFIGWMSNRIKSKSDPEENMYNRYMRCVDAGAAYGDAAPLMLDVDAFNNSSTSHTAVAWPSELDRNNSKLIETVHWIEVDADVHIMLDRMYAFLGEVATIAIPSRIVMKQVRKCIRVGFWEYDYADREDFTARRKKSTQEEQDANRAKRQLKTTSSWFRIRRENVPNLGAPTLPTPPASYTHVLMDAYTLDPYIYGRIQQFVQVDVAGGETLMLAKVKLYESSAAARYTGLRHIDLKTPLQYQHPRSQESVDLEYVQVAHLVSCIGIAKFPCIEIEIDPAKDAAAVRRLANAPIPSAADAASEAAKAATAAAEALLIRMYVLPIEV